MGACGSKYISKQGNSGASRDLSRWQVDRGEAAAPAGGSSEGSNTTQSDLTLNSVVAYRTATASNDTITEWCATGWEDGSIVIQNWKTNAVMTKVMPHSRAVNRLVIGSQTRAIYSCSRDTTIAMTSPSATESLVTATPATTVFSGHTLNVSSITLDVDESSLCSGGRDTRTILWDLATTKMKAKNTTAQNVITCSKWLPGERVIAQGSEDLSVKLWDERNGLRTPVQTLRGYIYFPLCLDITDDGFYLLTSSKGFNGVGCEARVWDRRTGKQLHQLEGHQQDATACCFFPPSLSAQTDEVGPTQTQDSIAVPTFATASKDGTMKVWDASSNQVVCEAHEPSTRMFTSMSYAGDEVILASTLHGIVHAFKFDPQTKSLALLNESH